MSRFEIHHEKKSLAFGNDHACGEYLMIWDTSQYREPDGDNVLVDEDTRFTGLTKERMEQLVQEHGFKIDELIEAKHSFST
jgi:hypothetical protein